MNAKDIVLKFGDQVIGVERIHDSSDNIDGYRARQMQITVEVSDGRSVDELDALFADYDGDFTLVNKDKEEVYTGFADYSISRNVERNSEQMMITLRK